MDLETVTLRLPPEMVAHLKRKAWDRDLTLGQITRDLIARDIRRDGAKTPNRADEQLVARLQRLLVPIMADATGWDDLARRLSRRGVDLRPAGGGLVLHRLSDGDRLCKASEIGFPYARLVRRFGAAMPRHPHQMEHLLKEIAAEADPDGDHDLVLIEDD